LHLAFLSSLGEKAFFSILLGLPSTTVARALAVSGSAVLQAIPRGQALAAARRGELTALVRAVLRRRR